MLIQQSHEISTKTDQIIAIKQEPSTPTEILSSQSSHKTKNRLLITLTAPSPKLSSEIDALVEECQNNSEQWPALHWAIAKLHRPDIAIHILHLYPEEINATTPKLRESLTMYRFAAWNDWQPEQVGFTTEGASALWLAVKEGYSDVVYALIQNGADLNVMRRFKIADNINQHWLEAPSSEYGTTPLSEALQLQNKEIAQLLLEKGASTDPVFYQTDYYTHNRHWKHNTSNYSIGGYLVKLRSEKDFWRIFIAAKTHQPLSNITEESLDFVRQRCEESMSPIQLACSRGDLESAQKLIDLGINPHANYGNPDICETLRRRGLTSESVEFLLRNNILRDNTDQAKFLLICIQDNLPQFLPQALAFGVACEEALRIAIERDQDHLITSLLDAHHPVGPPIIYQTIRSKNTSLLKKLIPLMKKEELQANFNRADSPIMDLLSDNPEALEVLFNQKFFFNRESFFRHACHKGSLLTVKILSKEYGFPYDLQKELITIAVRERRDELLNYLWNPT